MRALRLGARAPLTPPGERIYAIGDVHGRADLLAQLLDRIAADLAGWEGAGAPVLIFVGDYIDRGLFSREVVERLLRVGQEGYAPIFLRGNHEVAMLNFLDRPETGPGWFALGGAETLYSYGVRVPAPGASPEALRACARALRAALPQAHLHFFSQLDLLAQRGDYLFVHAGLRPGRALPAQTEQDLLEIRDPFLKSKKKWPFVVVHGHTPVQEVVQDGRRISIDTGAYATGRLSAVRLDGASTLVLST